MGERFILEEERYNSEAREDKSEKILEIIKEMGAEIAEKTIELRRKIHENPELGFQEYETAKLVEDRLRELGVEILGREIGGRKDKKGTGIVARIRGKEGGPVVALRADMDALPIQENSKLPYASRKDNVMHACGHDIHTASLLGAAEIFKTFSDRKLLEGDVILIFQPNEKRAIEKRSGSVEIIKFLERYKDDGKSLRQKIDAFFGMHVIASLERGTVKLKEGPQCTSSDRFDIEFEAPGGHVMGIHELPNINTLLAKITTRIDKEFNLQTPEPKHRDQLVTSTATKFGGPVTYNVLQKSAKSLWTLRILSAEFKKKKRKIIEKVKQIIQEETAAWQNKGSKVNFKFHHGTRPIIHRSPEMVKLGKKIAREIIGDSVIYDEKAMMGGEDFSFYLEKLRGKEIPGLFMMVGGANSQKGIKAVAHHTSEFNIDEEVIPEISQLYARAATGGLEYFRSQNK